MLAKKEGVVKRESCFGKSGSGKGGPEGVKVGIPGHELVWGVSKAGMKRDKWRRVGRAAHRCGISNRISPSIG